MTQPATPEHDKLLAVTDERDVVQHFLDWLLDERGLELAFYGTVSGHGDPPRDTHRLIPAHGSDPRLTPRKKRARGLRETLLALYFDIDLDKLAAEKDELLAAVRAANERPEIEVGDDPCEGVLDRYTDDELRGGVLHGTECEDKDPYK